MSTGSPKGRNYRWRAKYGDLEVSEAPAPSGTGAGRSALEGGGRRADAGQAGFEGRSVERMVTPAARSEATTFFRERHQLSERRACGLVGISRSPYRYVLQDRDEDSIAQRLCELAAERPRFGYRHLHSLLGP